MGVVFSVVVNVSASDDKAVMLSLGLHPTERLSMLEDPFLEIRFRNKGKLSRLEDTSRATNEWLAEAKMKKNINRIVLNIVDISNSFRIVSKSTKR